MGPSPETPHTRIICSLPPARLVHKCPGGVHSQPCPSYLPVQRTAPQPQADLLTTVEEYARSLALHAGQMPHTTMRPWRRGPEPTGSPPLDVAPRQRSRPLRIQLLSQPPAAAQACLFPVSN